MDTFLVELTVGILLVILLHELLHIIALKYYGVEIAGIFLLLWGIGGLGPWIDEGMNKIFYRNRRVVVCYLAPIVLSPLVLFTDSTLLWVMGAFNILGSIGDYASLIQILRTPKQMRMAKERKANAWLFNKRMVRIIRFKRKEV